MKTPWFKQFWPWFLIALPLSVVIASLITFRLFHLHQVTLVSEDYYKEGKGINIDRSRFAHADKLKIQAEIQINPELAILTLDKGLLPHFPALHIKFQHRTLAEQDLEFMLNPDAKGRYRIPIQHELSGPWYIEITTFDRTWALSHRIHLPTTESVALYGKIKG